MRRARVSLHVNGKCGKGKEGKGKRGTGERGSGNGGNGERGKRGSGERGKRGKVIASSPFTRFPLSFFPLFPVLLLLGGFYEFRDFNLLHLEHCLHDPIRFLFVWILQQLHEDGWHDLPRQAVFILYPTAL